MTTLASLKEALGQPFAAQQVQFLPKAVQQDRHRQWICLALPYANKRIYEDRLNAVAFGEWSTPYTPPYTEGTKLIVPATVIVCEVTHTDYGEASLAVTSRQGKPHEAENSATEAYSQAFRRACSKFLLGRYLYDLRKLWLPYDVNAKRIAISEAERITWVEKLYLEAGLLPRSYALSPSVSPERVSNPEPSAARASTTSPSGERPSEYKQTQQGSSVPKASSERASSQVATRYPGNLFLDWVASQVNRDPDRIMRICTHYRVQQLSQLTQVQRADLTRRLKAQHVKPSHTPVLSGSSVVSHGGS